MTIERPPEGRTIITTSSDEITIEIPSYKNIIIIIFLSIFMFMWCYVELVLLLFFFVKTHMSVVESVFFGIWLLVWSVVGYIPGRVLLWNISGKEIIRIRNGILSIKKKYL